MVEDGNEGGGYGELKRNLKDILDNFDQEVDIESINYLVFGYKLSRKGEREVMELAEYNVQLSNEVRRVVASQFKENLKSICDDNVQFVDIGSTPGEDQSFIQVCGLDVVNIGLREIVENPETDQGASLERVDSMQHPGLLTIINLRNGTRIIGIDTLVRKKIAVGKRKMVGMDRRGSLNLVRDTLFFYLSERFAAIFYNGKFLIRNADTFLRIFVLNNYIDSLFNENIEGVTRYIDDPEGFYKRIKGDFRRERVLITLIKYTLHGNVSPEMYRRAFDEYRSFFPEVRFDGEKIKIEESNIDQVLNLLLRKYDMDPIEPVKKRKVNPQLYG
jgi:hypothetical protein